MKTLLLSLVALSLAFAQPAFACGGVAVAVGSAYGQAVVSAPTVFAAYSCPATFAAPAVAATKVEPTVVAAPAPVVVAAPYVAQASYGYGAVTAFAANHHFVNTVAVVRQRNFVAVNHAVAVNRFGGVRVAAGGVNVAVGNGGGRGAVVVNQARGRTAVRVNAAGGNVRVRVR